MSQHSNLPYHTIADKQRQERMRRVVDTANACLLHSSAGPSIPPFSAAREATPWCIVCHAWRIRGSVLKPQQPTLGRIRPERRPREAWQPSHVPTRISRHGDETCFPGGTHPDWEASRAHRNVRRDGAWEHGMAATPHAGASPGESCQALAAAVSRHFSGFWRAR